MTLHLSSTRYVYLLAYYRSRDIVVCECVNVTTLYKPSDNSELAYCGEKILISVTERHQTNTVLYKDILLDHWLKLWFQGGPKIYIHDFQKKKTSFLEAQIFHSKSATGTGLP